MPLKWSLWCVIHHKTLSFFKKKTLKIFFKDFKSQSGTFNSPSFSLKVH